MMVFFDFFSTYFYQGRNDFLQIFYVEVGSFWEDEFNIVFIDKAFFVNHNNDGRFVCWLLEVLGLLFHEFVAIEHAEKVDNNIPLVINVQVKFSNPSQQFFD